MRFKWGFDEEDSGCKELKLELLQQIMALRRYYQVTRFMVACDPGVGLYSAEAIRILRESDKKLMLFCVTPHEEQATKWAPYLRERYFSMLESCTYLSAACKEKTPTRQLEAYKCIISSSDIVLAVYDPASFRNDDVDKAMAFAAKQKKPVILIHPDSLEVSRYPGKLQP